MSENKLYTFFYRSDSPFSNFYPSQFEVKGVKFSSMEQYMMWSKAKLFGDETISKAILKEKNPSSIKKLGRQVKNFDEKKWKEHREKIVRKGLIEKFSSNEKIYKSLIETYPSLLVEASPTDRIWGIGFSADKALRVEKEKWGLNLLGKLLTQVRDEFITLQMEELTEKVNMMTLKEVKTFIKTTDIETLNQFKIYLDDLYYNTGDSVLEDVKYDLIKDYITKKQPEKATIGATIRQGDNRVELPFWLGSADKITPDEPDQLKRWLKNNNAENYIVSAKLDGVSCLLVNKKGKLSLYTRGDGIIGADISYLANYIKLPSIATDIAVRGELIMDKNIFETKYKGTYKNPRNMVSGLVGSKTARKGLVDLNFVVYEKVGDSMPKPSKQLKELKQLGFTVVEHLSIDSVKMKQLTELYLKFRKESRYELDGIVVQSDLPYDRNTSGNPDYMFAFKMLTEDSIFTTRVKSIEWNTSKWGVLKPVVIIEPVELSGITMSRATAHNAKYVQDNRLGPNAVIKITRSKEVIPYIVEVVKPADQTQMPDIPYVWDKNHVNISVEQCDDDMCVKLIADFFSKLGIKFVSEATVKKLFTNGLDNLFKILEADKDRLLEVPEFQDKSAERIYTNIHNGFQNVKVSTVLGASGVLGYGIGAKKIDSLLKDIPDLLEWAKGKSTEEIRKKIELVDGFSYITADKIATNLKYGIKLIKKLKKYATFQVETRVSNSLQGEKIVMTGFRDKKLEEEINSRGGKVIGSVSKNTTILIVAKKDCKLTDKVQKAKSFGIPIYEKEEFINRYIV